MTRLFTFACLICLSFNLPVTLLAQTTAVRVEGSGIPLVMIPGGSFSIAAFDAHAKVLSDRFRVLRFERINVTDVKENLPLPLNYSVHMETEAILRQLDSLQVREPVFLVGHSYGGLIALELALDHPDRVRGLVLVEPPVFWLAVQKGEHPEGMDDMIAVCRQFGPRAEITESQLEKFHCALGECPGGRSARENPLWSTWVKNIPFLKGLSAVVQINDSLPRLRSFQKPVLIVTGSRTVPFHRRINELLSQELPNNSHLSLDGGHIACVTNAIQPFTKGVEAWCLKN